VLRQLSSVARGFEAVAISEADSVPTELRWMDATGPDEAEMCGAARLLGFSPSVLEWLNDPNRSTRPRAIDDALTFALAVPAFDGSASPKVGVSTIVVAITEHRTFTAHDRASEWVVAGAARRVTGRPPGEEAHAAVLSLVEEIIDQYDHVVTDMGDRLAVHSTEVLKSSDRRRSPNDVVAEGLRLATDISDVQRQLRRLRQALGALRALASGPGSGVTASLADSLDACSRALDALNVDLDALNHRLELTTDAQLNLLSWRQGEINKTIGAWAGVFAINAVITGFYGMNIKGLPGDQSWVTVAIIMASVSVVLIAFFRKIDWL
jgi:Mg2+ and Co2+ transporter CorA